MDFSMKRLEFKLQDQGLRDYMDTRDCQGLPRTELRPTVHQLATALHHLHSIKIVHVDLRPDNIMLMDHEQQPFRARLIDFGLVLPPASLFSICGPSVTGCKK